MSTIQKIYDAPEGAVCPSCEITILGRKGVGEKAYDGEKDLICLDCFSIEAAKANLTKKREGVNA
jgi:hypothetical protein